MVNTFFPTEADIPAQYKLSGPVDQTTYLVGGKQVPWTGPTQEVLSPICIRDGETVKQKVIGHYPLMDKEASMQTLDAAIRAYDSGDWPRMTVRDRIQCTQDFVKRMSAVRDETVNLIMWEIGKTYPDAAKEFDRTVTYINDTIEALKEIDRTSSQPTVREEIFAQIRRSPIGKVLCMGPSNYPLNETFTTLIPAIIMGNTTVFKPAKYGVLLHKPLMDAYQNSFPEGVINIVYGDGRVVVTPQMQSGAIDMLAFIGSSKVADDVINNHPKKHHFQSVLGLNAKNPAIILPSANLEEAVTEGVAGALGYNGQRCTALKIFYVPRSLAGQFSEMFAAKVDSLKAGMPWEDKVKITPLYEVGAPQKFERIMLEAIAKGAKLINNGGTINNTFFKPAVLFGVQPGCELYHEEQFGPVVPIVVYDDIQEVKENIHRSEYGQQASIFGYDPHIVGSLIDFLVLEASRVNLNMQCQRGPDIFPFTGRKRSAQKTLSVSDALRVFSIRSMVGAKTTPSNIELVERIQKLGTSNFMSRDWII